MNELETHVLGIVSVYQPCSAREVACHTGESPALCVRMLCGLAGVGLVQLDPLRGYLITEPGKTALLRRDRGLFGADLPAARQSCRQKDKIHLRALTKQQVAKIYSNCRGAVARGSRLAWTRLIVFGLATSCGLRVSEIAGLTIGDVDILSEDGRDPVLRIRRETTKSDAGEREVPADWNVDFLQDVRSYLRFRFGADWEEQREALAVLPFVVGFRQRTIVPSRKAQGLFDFAGEREREFDRADRHLHRNTIRNYFIGAVKTAVDVERFRATTHLGRHTYGTHAVESGISLAKLMETMGHSGLQVTSKYTHFTRDRSDVNRMGRMYAHV